MPAHPEALTRALGAVCEVYGLEPRQVLGKARTGLVSEARQTLFYVMKIVIGWSYPDIARYAGKDHTTVMHGVRVTAKRLAANEHEAAQTYQRVLSVLREKDIRIGDVVQLAPKVAGFGGVLLVVSAVDGRSVTGYVRLPGVPDKSYTVDLDRAELAKIGEVRWRDL